MGQTDGRGVVLKKKWEKPETRLKLPQRVLGQSSGEKTILLLSAHVRTPLVATFVEC